MDEKANVLIVDDEVRIVRSVDRLLRAHYNVFTATNGKEALDILRKHRIHVILSDQRMPEMTGVELLAKVKQLSTNTTRVLLTGYSDLSAVVHSVNEGEIFRYITKPWNNEELLEVVARAADIALDLFRVALASPEATANDGAESTVLALDSQNELKANLEALIGKKASIVSVTNSVSAIDYLAKNDVTVIVADSSNNVKDILAFISVVKNAYPHILSIAITDRADAHRLIDLINEGQIYRYMAKPVSLGQLKIFLMSAIRYQKKLVAQPELVKRHQVQEIADQETREIGNSLFQRLRAFLFQPVDTPVE